MSTRALHIHVTGPTAAPDHENITVGGTILIGISDDDAISDSFSVEIGLKVLGIYKTSIQINAAIAAEVKDFLYTSRSIPTNGYAVTYVSGAYGLLEVL